jgi:hypothetical protein
MKETRRGGIQTIQQIIRRLSEENQERRNPNNSTSHQDITEILLKWR